MPGVKKDKGEQEPYDGDDWTSDDGFSDETHERQYPVLYIAGTKMKIGKLKIQTIDLSAAIEFSLTGIGHFQEQYGGVAYTYDPDTKQITFWDMEASKALPTTVGYVNDYIINWTLGYKLPGTEGEPAEWHHISAGQTNNRVYRSLAAGDAADRFETVVHVSCTGAAGNTDGDGAFDDIWNRKYKTLAIPVVDENGMNGSNNDILKYWGPGLGGGDVPHLMRNYNGSCAAWKLMLIATSKLQGNNLVQGITIGAGASHDHLKFWSSMKGQGNAVPVDVDFGNHEINKYEGYYYDAAYGRVFNSQYAYEVSMIDLVRIASTQQWVPYPILGWPIFSWSN